MFKSWLGLPLFVVCLPSVMAKDVVWLGPADATQASPPAPWRLVQFDRKIPPTRFQVRLWDGVPAIEAVADGSMALLARAVEVDLAQTPVLCWRWRIDAPLATADMATKAGDDYAARVYVAFDLPDTALSFSTRMKLRLARSLYGEDVPEAALNYVWDNRYPVGTQRPNAYTDRTRMIVLRSGAADGGQWVTERRDVLADFKQAFGSDPTKIQLVAIASDTDNTGERAHAGFAQLHFVSRDHNCANQ